MKQFFDTSVLLAAFLEDEPRHEACASALASAANGCAYLHALAECFSILTGGRLSVRLSALDAVELIEANIVERLEVITLTPKETTTALRKCQSAGVRGGGIFDFLHLTAARKFAADEILTLNVRHFLAFAPDLLGQIKTPS